MIQIHKKRSRRILAVEAMIPAGYTVADVGCDHALVSIDLIEQGIARRCIAMDVREGPLANARENIAVAGLADRIETRLSDGLMKLEAGEAEVILMAGMGGILMRNLLVACPDTVRAARYLVLEPQSDVHLVRSALRELQFAPVREDMVEEDGKYYPIMLAEQKPDADGGVKAPDEQSGAAPGTVMERVFDKYGPKLLQEQHPVMFEFLCRRERHYARILDNEAFLHAETDEAKQQLQKIREEAADVAMALSFYGGDRKGER